jgi:hypothetical protein
MEIVAKLQRQPVLAGRKLHLDDVLAVAEVYPWRRTWNHRSRWKTVGINSHMMVADIRAALCRGAWRNGRKLIVFDAELEPHRTFDGGAVLRLNEEDPWPRWLRSAA